MAFITADLSRLPLDARERVVKHLQHEDAAKFALAQIEQAKLAQWYRSLPPDATRDGFGPVNMAMTPYLRNMIQGVYGAQCFMDEDFRRWLRKRHEEVAVPERATRTQVGWQPIEVAHG